MYKKVLTSTLLITLAIVLSGCSGQAEELPVEEEKILSVQTLIIQSNQTSSDHEITGEIKPIRTARLNAASSDIVGEIYADIGEEVTEGELLASLVGETTLQNIENARTALINARQNSLLATLSGNITVRQAESDFEKATKQLALAKETFETTKIAQESNIKATEATLARALIDSDISIERAARDLQNTIASTDQQLDALHDTIVQNARNTMITLESQLEFADRILGVREPGINDSFQGHLGVRDFVNRDRAYTYNRDAIRKLELARQTFASGDPEDYFQKSMDAAYAMKLLLDTLSNVLRDSVVNVDLPADMLNGFKAETDQAQASVNQIIQTLENTDQNLRATKISVDQQLTNAEATLRQAKQDKDGEKDTATVREAKARLENTKALASQQIEQSSNAIELAEIDLKKARNAVEAARASHGTQSNSAKTQEDSQAGQLALAIAQRNQLELRAPFDGVITRKPANQGERIGAGSTVIEVADLKAAKVEFFINPEDALSLEIGYKVQVGDALGEVIKIAPSADPDARKILVEAALEQVGENIFGSLAPVSLNIVSKKQVIAVPLTSVYMSESEKYVYALEDGVIRQRKIEIGKLRGDIIEITFGLEEGDEVIVDRNENIQQETRATSQ